MFLYAYRLLPPEKENRREEKLDLLKHGLSHSRHNGRYVLVAIALLSVVMAGVIVCSQSVFEAHALPSITLTVVGPNGNQVVLTETNIGSMPSYTAYGGEWSKGGLKYPGYYTGVPITTLVATAFSGYNYSVTTVGYGNYNITFTYSELSGNGLQTYNSTGGLVSASQGLTVMLAYYYNGTALSSILGGSGQPGSYGPLEVAIVGPEGLYTKAGLWNYGVTELAVGGGTSVGGLWAPITLQVLSPLNVLQLLAPWITLACLVSVAAASVAYVKLRKKP